jgi:hypothetical protein
MVVSLLFMCFFNKLLPNKEKACKSLCGFADFVDLNSGPSSLPYCDGYIRLRSAVHCRDGQQELAFGLFAGFINGYLHRPRRMNMPGFHL